MDSKLEQLQALYDDAWKRLRDLKALAELYTMLAQATQAMQRATSGDLAAYYRGQADAYRVISENIAAVLEGWQE